MNVGKVKSLLFAVLCGFCAFEALAATSLFSNYGQIQNVQNYSSNPFWTPNSPYNQRMPQPVYVQGADLNTEDCIKVVQSLVSVQCMARDNCKNTSVSDIRPTIMVQLSNLPGNNYVTACAGYLDGVFEQYLQQYGNALPNRAVAFPDATTPNRNLMNNSDGIQIQNPYKQKTPQWQQEINERRQELQELQQQNGADSYGLSATAFPKTYADLSFSERMKNDTAGLEPYKDKVAFRSLNVKSAEEWCSEHENSSDCIKWRDCTEIAHASDEEVTLATYNNKRVCEVKQCVDGYTPNKQKNGCMQAKGINCTNQFKNDNPSVEHVVRAEIDENGQCRIVDCESGYRPTSSRMQCEEIPATPDNNDDGDNNDDDDTTPGQDDTTRNCLEELGNPDHATAAEPDENDDCVITKCEDLWHPNSNGTKCEEDTEWYDLRIYHLAVIDRSKTTGNDQKCYDICENHTTNSDVNKKLFSILGKRYCVPQDNDLTLIYNTKHFILRDVDTNTSIKMSYKKMVEVRQALADIANRGECDKWSQKQIVADVYKHDGNSESQEGNSIKLDD